MAFFAISKIGRNSIYTLSNKNPTKKKKRIKSNKINNSSDLYLQTILSTQPLVKAIHIYYATQVNIVVAKN